MGQGELLGAQPRICNGEVKQDNVCPCGGEDRSVMIAQEARSAGDDSDAAGEIEEGLCAVGFGRHSGLFSISGGWR